MFGLYGPSRASLEMLATENGQKAHEKRSFRTIHVIFAMKIFRVTLSTILKQLQGSAVINIPK